MHKELTDNIFGTSAKPKNEDANENVPEEASEDATEDASDEANEDANTVEVVPLTAAQQSIKALEKKRHIMNDTLRLRLEARVLEHGDAEMAPVSEAGL